jgi:hypothetical protein
MSLDESRTRWFIYININLFAFSTPNLFRSFVTIKPIAENARSEATELATVLKILTASRASLS